MSARIMSVSTTPAAFTELENTNRMSLTTCQNYRAKPTNHFLTFYVSDFDSVFLWCRYDSQHHSLSKKCKYKKVLLRECKSHTTRRVASTPSVVLSRGGGVTHLDLARGVPIPGWGGRYPRVPSPRCGQTHTCENITLPHSVGNTSGNYCFGVSQSFCSVNNHINTIEINISMVLTGAQVRNFSWGANPHVGMQTPYIFYTFCETP